MKASREALHRPGWNHKGTTKQKRLQLHNQTRQTPLLQLARCRPRSGESSRNTRNKQRTVAPTRPIVHRLHCNARPRIGRPHRHRQPATLAPFNPPPKRALTPPISPSPWHTRIIGAVASLPPSQRNNQRLPTRASNSSQALCLLCYPQSPPRPPSFSIGAPVLPVP